jgi:hypothetical protein
MSDGVIRTEVFDEHEQRRRLAIAETSGLETFDPDDLDVLEYNGNRLLVHRPDGTLWAQTSRGMADILGRDAIRVVFEGPPGKLTPRYLVRASRTVGEIPETLGELEERQARRAAVIEASRRDQSGGRGRRAAETSRARRFR